MWIHMCAGYNDNDTCVGVSQDVCGPVWSGTRAPPTPASTVWTRPAHVKHHQTPSVADIYISTIFGRK